MGIQEPEIEAFESEVIDSLLDDLAKTPQGIAFATAQREKGVEQGIEKIAEKMIVGGKSDGETSELTDLSFKVIGRLREKLSE